MFGPLFDRIALCSTVRKRVETIGREQVKEGGNLFYFRGRLVTVERSELAMGRNLHKPLLKLFDNS